jgi:hypothetical protein
MDLIEAEGTVDSVAGDCDSVFVGPQHRFNDVLLRLIVRQRTDTTVHLSRSHTSIDCADPTRGLTSNLHVASQALNRTRDFESH